MRIGNGPCGRFARLFLRVGSPLAEGFDQMVGSVGVRRGHMSCEAPYGHDIQACFLELLKGGEPE